ncbi:MAG: hypothetical protein ACYST5_08550, partial [Planctomycetota bacterium]
MPAKPHRGGLQPALKIDDGSLVRPFLGVGVAVHKAERAGIAVEDAQRVVERISSGAIGPAV